MADQARRWGGSALPSGTLTFLFTDIQGSTRLVTALGSAFGPVLERHQAILRAAFRDGGGIEISTEGDAFFVVFQRAAAAVVAAAAAQRALASEPWSAGVSGVLVRMGIHTGDAILGGDNYVGVDVHRAARIAAAAHGGQVLVSAATAALVAGSLPSELTLRSLGEFRLKDLDRPERLLQLAGAGLADDFPPPRTLDSPSNVPLQLTSFIGRDREIEEVGDLLRTARLVTLTGPGGTGKTRLSLRVAEELRQGFSGGVTGGARDLPDRQRTLRGAIDWSYDLLDEAERAFFRRLAIFVGGCTVEAASAVCDPDPVPGFDALDGLSSLVDKSLLRPEQASGGEPRFRMLATIREYGLERLKATADDEPVRRRYVDYFAGLARQAQPELLGSRQKAWLDRLEAEHDNLRAALQSAADDGRLEVALDMGAALWRFWQQRGHIAEGRASLSALLDQPPAAGTAARARALGGLGGLTWWQGDFTAAELAYTEALQIERALHDPSGLAEALYNAGYVAALKRDAPSAQANYEEAIQLYESIGDDNGVLRVREALVFFKYQSGDFVAARALQEENMRAFRAVGESFRIANGLNLLSGINLRDGEFEAAHGGLAEAAAMFRAADDMAALFRTLIIAGALAMAEADPARAARLAGAAATLKEPLGEIATPLQLLHLEDPAQGARLALGDETFGSEFSAGRAMNPDQMVALVSA